MSNQLVGRCIGCMHDFTVEKTCGGCGDVDHPRPASETKSDVKPPIRVGGLATLPPKRVTPIGTAIRQWRMRQRPKVSQAKLARMLGWDHSYVSRIEDGTRDVSLMQLAPLAKLLDLDERDVALMIAGYDPALYRQEIEQALWARLKAVIGPGAEEADAA